MPIKRAALAFLLLASAHCAPIWAAEQEQDAGLRIDIPVPLKDSKIVFNMDHLAFSGDQPAGLAQMKTIVQSYKTSRTPVHIVAVFHGPAGYMLLNDATYNKHRKIEKGNPFKVQVAALQSEGVQFELCVNTAKRNGWINADLLPGIKMNGGANLRIIQLVQDGYVQMQP
ncbi:MAG: DsrE family protein [Rhodomicrobium sp.]